MQCCGRGPEARVVQGAQGRQQRGAVQGGGRQVRGGAQVRGPHALQLLTAHRPQALGAVVMGLAVAVRALGGLEGGSSGRGTAGQLQAAVGVAQRLPGKAQALAAHGARAELQGCRGSMEQAVPRGLRRIALLPALLFDLHVALRWLPWGAAQEAGQAQAAAQGRLAAGGLRAHRQLGAVLLGWRATLLDPGLALAPEQKAPAGGFRRGPAQQAWLLQVPRGTNDTLSFRAGQTACAPPSAQWGHHSPPTVTSGSPWWAPGSDKPASPAGPPHTPSPALGTLGNQLCRRSSQLRPRPDGR